MRNPQRGEKTAEKILEEILTDGNCNVALTGEVVELG